MIPSAVQWRGQLHGAHSGVMEAYPGAVAAHPGAVETHPGAVKGAHHKPGRLTLELQYEGEY
jgi:hypothetical protein